MSSIDSTVNQVPSRLTNAQGVVERHLAGPAQAGAGDGGRQVEHRSAEEPEERSADGAAGKHARKVEERDRRAHRRKQQREDGGGREGRRVELGQRHAAVDRRHLVARTLSARLAPAQVRHRTAEGGGQAEVGERDERSDGVEEIPDAQLVGRDPAEEDRRLHQADQRRDREADPRRHHAACGSPRRIGHGLRICHGARRC
jgi:hypothetical protein